MEDRERLTEQGMDPPRGRRRIRHARARGEVVRCGACGEAGHTTAQCRNRPLYEGESAVPLEHKGGNGEYTGPALVRVLPPGVFGADLDREEGVEPGSLTRSRVRGGVQRKVRAALDREVKRAQILRSQAAVPPGELEEESEELEDDPAEEPAAAEASPPSPRGKGRRERPKKNPNMVRSGPKRCGRCGRTGHNARTCARIPGTKRERTNERTNERKRSKGDAPDGVEERNSKGSRGGGPSPRPSSSPSDIVVAGPASIRIRVKERKDGVDVDVSVVGIEEG